MLDQIKTFAEDTAHEDDNADKQRIIKAVNQNKQTMGKQIQKLQRKVNAIKKLYQKSLNKSRIEKKANNLLQEELFKKKKAVEAQEKQIKDQKDMITSLKLSLQELHKMQKDVGHSGGWEKMGTVLASNFVKGDGKLQNEEVHR